MSDSYLLKLYDKISEYVDDEILDEADELFTVDGDTPGDLIPNEYYIWVSRKYLENNDSLS